MKYLRILPAFILLLIMLSSCTKHLKYIQDRGEDVDSTRFYTSNQPAEYRIQPYDVLYIKVISTNSEINELFAQVVSTSFNSGGSGSSNQQNMYFTGYTVTDTGYIQVPILGNFFVENKTLKEVRELVRNRVDSMLVDAVTDVKLTSFTVTFLGEISNTTTVFYRESVNILEAIASVGGIDDTGDKTKVMVIRKTEDGSKVYRIDLTKRDLLESEDYYLQPNDIVYIEPIKSKVIRYAISDYTFVLSLLTTTLSSIMFIITINRL